MTTPRKPRPYETETDQRRTEKENLTVTVDLSKETGVKPSFLTQVKKISLSVHTHLNSFFSNYFKPIQTGFVGFLLIFL